MTKTIVWIAVKYRSTFWPSAPGTQLLLLWLWKLATLFTCNLNHTAAIRTCKSHHRDKRATRRKNGSLKTVDWLPRGPRAGCTIRKPKNRFKSHSVHINAHRFKHQQKQKENTSKWPGDLTHSIARNSSKFSLHYCDNLFNMLWLCQAKWKSIPFRTMVDFIGPNKERNGNGEWTIGWCLSGAKRIASPKTWCWP